MSLHTTHAWHQRAGLNMNKAMQAQTNAVIQMEHSQRAHEEVIEGNLDMYNTLTSTMQQKVKTTHGLLEALRCRAESVQRSITTARQSIMRLEAALVAKEAPSQLCIWHMDQRKMRPKRELVRDIVEVTLEEERNTIADAQQQLREAISRTRGVIGELEGRLREIRADVDHKSQAAGLDEMCLRSASSSYGAALSRAGRPLSASGVAPSKWRRSEDHPALRETRRNELVRERKAHHLERSTENQEDLARSLNDDNDRLMARLARSVEAAAQKSEHAMQVRLNENQNMRRKLEAELKETEDKIEQTVGTISDTRYQMTALEEPVELAEACTSWRTRRAMPENIMDPVSTRIADHQSAAMKARRDLAEHQERERERLRQLQESREQLTEDIRDKLAAYHIDNQCLANHSMQPRNTGPRPPEYDDDGPYFSGSRSDLEAASVQSLPRPDYYAPSPAGSVMSLPRSELQMPTTSGPRHYHSALNGAATPSSAGSSDVRTALDPRAPRSDRGGNSTPSSVVPGDHRTAALGTLYSPMHSGANSPLAVGSAAFAAGRLQLRTGSAPCSPARGGGSQVSNRSAPGSGIGTPTYGLQERTRRLSSLHEEAGSVHSAFSNRSFRPLTAR